MIAKRSVKKRLVREQIAADVIIFCLGTLLVSVLAIRFLDVKIVNIKEADRNLYTIVTERGSINVVPAEILRIEQTFTKTALTGHPVELDKIYTDKGFIYVSSQDSFAPLGRKLINRVDFEGLPVWQRPDTSLQSVQPYAYAIGTPAGQIPWVFFFLTLQYWSMSVGGIALAVLIFPLRWEGSEPASARGPAQAEPEFLAPAQEEKKVGAIAK
ncbi:Hypothetical protein DEACI_2533 [Acididesulfobacillus acetoxydans]|uniref:Uncharacterized protein n=1 Tax=Acididesulfobacillus acetoxydans TaxID=1561005 RepID=A0A8S0VXG0_9FIRM|nr:hypothetical protein [Acididesulfobacillus acetoxydans]CAA7601863.1 Hypothetical protein DEACI_2533 [Acididesulfobacillus acetoxydans]CEJ08293.1 Hypothetical protein DEACI_2769 [Acididesulfobacillus acetoxydans]